MSTTGTLTLSFFNANGDVADDVADVFGEHTKLSSRFKIQNHNTKSVLPVPDLDSSPGGAYILKIVPRKYRAVGRVIKVSEGQDTSLKIILPFQPDQVLDTRLPGFDELPAELQQRLEASSITFENAELSGAALYERLRTQKLQAAGLLNLYAKMKSTVLTDGTNIFSHVLSFTGIEQDRVFVRIAPALPQLVTDDEQFRGVSGAKHETPDAFTRKDSFKTKETFGNLQLTFFESHDGSEALADVDIDDAAGLKHVFDVIKHDIKDEKTHPYDIYQILLAGQNLDPGYELLV